MAHGHEDQLAAAALLGRDPVDGAGARHFASPTRSGRAKLELAAGPHAARQRHRRQEAAARLAWPSGPIADWHTAATHNIQCQGGGSGIAGPRRRVIAIERGGQRCHLGGCSSNCLPDLSCSRISVVVCGPITDFFAKSMRMNVGAPISSGKPVAQSSPRAQSNADCVAQSSGFEPSKSAASTGRANRARPATTRFRMDFMAALT
jgi:hypothetical protein